MPETFLGVHIPSLRPFCTKCRKLGHERIQCENNGGCYDVPMTDEEMVKFLGEGEAIRQREVIRHFESGAMRSSDADKPDFEGFISPLVVERFGEYMHKHRHLPDGSLRASDNWQKGIPLEQLVKSAYRHFMDWWMFSRGFSTRETIEDSLCALIFNASAYLHAKLLERKYRAVGEVEKL